MGQIAKFPHFFGLDFALAIGPDGLGLLQDHSIGLHSCSIILTELQLPVFAKNDVDGVFYGQKVLFKANCLELLSHLGCILADFSVKIVMEIRHNVDNQCNLAILQSVQPAFDLKLVCHVFNSLNHTQQQLIGVYGKDVTPDRPFKLLGI